MSIQSLAFPYDKKIGNLMNVICDNFVSDKLQQEYIELNVLPKPTAYPEKNKEGDVISSFSSGGLNVFVGVILKTETCLRCTLGLDC